MRGETRSLHFVVDAAPVCGSRAPMSRSFDGPSRAGALPLVGGVLALDFCNTCSGRGSEGLQEHLRSAPDLVAWARHAGILDEEKEEALLRLCGSAAFGLELLEKALGLREAIYRLDASIALGEVPAQADLDAIARAHAASLSKGQLTTREGGFGWSWPVESAAEETIIGPITASAMSLLAQADHARLKQCPGHHCGWLFLETTKNKTRRWCEMEVCGNRAKQQRHRDRSTTGR